MTNIKIVHGNILKWPISLVYPTYLLQSVNCRKKMAAGLAGETAKKYPFVEKIYRSKDLSLGDVLTIQVARNQNVVLLAGQDRYGTDQRYTDYDAIRKALLTFQVEISSVIAPKINILIPEGMGCGLGGGEWSEVDKIIQETLVQNNLNITYVRYNK